MINVYDTYKDTKDNNQAINTIRQDIKCWYCFKDGLGEGYFLDDCQLLKLNKLKSFMYYNLYEGNLYIGAHRAFTVPLKLLFVY